MSQAILVSNNQVINSLYEVNLRAYVATNVTIKPTIQSALELLEHSLSVDAFICFKETLDEYGSIDDLLNVFSEQGIKTPLIVLGSVESDSKQVIKINNKYNIKLLLQSMAKILEVTAQEMASMRVPKYFPIPIKLFKQMNTSHCRVFMREEKDNFEYDYTQVLEKDIPVRGEFDGYIEDGVEHLYIDADERLRFINRASALIVEELSNDKLSGEEKMEITSQGMEMVAEEIFDNPEMTSEIAAVSKACIESIEGICKEFPKVKSLLKMLMENQSDYCFKHSILATYIAGEIVDNISWGSEEQKSKVAFSLFFHDIFLLPIYKKHPNAISEEDLLFQDEVSEVDKEIILDHAKMAGHLVKEFPRAPLGADMLITQHHGMTSGKGFAVNYKDDISPLAKIMIIAEDIGTTILIQTKEEGKLNFNKKAVCKQLKEKYRAHTYRKVIEAFEASKI